jgi:hypothetical protein
MHEGRTISCTAFTPCAVTKGNPAVGPPPHSPEQKEDKVEYRSKAAF